MSTLQKEESKYRRRANIVLTKSELELVVANLKITGDHGSFNSADMDQLYKELCIGLERMNDPIHAKLDNIAMGILHNQDTGELTYEDAYIKAKDQLIDDITYGY
jgi:hypothetical protein